MKSKNLRQRLCAFVLFPLLAVMAVAVSAFSSGRAHAADELTAYDNNITFSDVTFDKGNLDPIITSAKLYVSAGGVSLDFRTGVSSTGSLLPEIGGVKSFIVTDPQGMTTLLTVPRLYWAKDYNIGLSSLFDVDEICTNAGKIGTWRVDMQISEFGLPREQGCNAFLTFTVGAVGRPDAFIQYNGLIYGGIAFDAGDGPVTNAWLVFNKNAGALSLIFTTGETVDGAYGPFQWILTAPLGVQVAGIPGSAGAFKPRTTYTLNLGEMIDPQALLIDPLLVGEYSMDFAYVYNGETKVSTLTFNVALDAEKPPFIEIPGIEVPTKPGHTFAGWYFDEALTQPYDGSAVTDDMVFYAKFNINSYTVTFDVAGGAALDAVTVEYLTELPLPTPRRAGYDFKGWYNGDTLVESPLTVAADATLTAAWELKLLTVDFYVDGTLYKTLTVPYGTTLDSFAKTESGYLIRAVKMDSAALGDGFGPGAFFRSDAVVYGETKGQADTALDFLSRYWLAILLGIVAFAALCAILVPFTKRRRGR